MRAYTVATVALALDVPVKWVDNILSHHRLPGVVQARQGIARRLTTEAAVVLDVALRLIRSLEIPTAIALHIASDLAGSDSDAHSRGDCELRLDVRGLRIAVSARLAQAVEVTPVPRRGRPRSRVD